MPDHAKQVGVLCQRVIAGNVPDDDTEARRAALLESIKGL